MTPMISPVILLALAALPGEDHAWDIREQVIQVQDCKIFRVGAKDETLCDLSPAFKRIEDAIRATLPVGWLGYGTRTGAQVTIPPGRFFISTPVRFCRQMTVRGAGGSYPGAITTVYTPKGGSGFRFAHAAECTAAGLGMGSMGSVIEELAIIEATGPVPNSHLSWGILLEADATVRNVWTNGFVQGVRISADVTRKPATAASRWRLFNVIAIYPEHAGIYVEGGDANAGLGEASSVVHGCDKGSTWISSLGACADIIDNSLIGNTWVAMHASGSVDSTTGVNFPNYALGVGKDGQKTVCVGCYSESDNSPPLMGKHAMVLGQQAMTFVGSGYAQAGERANGISYVNSKDAANAVTTNFGTQSAAGAGLEMVPSGGTLPTAAALRIKAEPSTKTWRTDVQNNNLAVAFRIGADVNSNLGQLLLKGTTTGTPAAALCSAGAVYFEKSPTIKGPVGYQCASGIWRSFR